MDETTKKLREFVYQSVKHMVQGGDTVSDGIMSLYVQFLILDMLDSIDSRLIGLEDEVSKLNPDPVYKE